MSTKYFPLTDSEKNHPLTFCRDCSHRHTEEKPLVRLSVKNPFEDDYYYECKGGCDYDEEEF